MFQMRKYNRKEQKKRQNSSNTRNSFISSYHNRMFVEHHTLCAIQTHLIHQRHHDENWLSIPYSIVFFSFTSLHFVSFNVISLLHLFMVRYFISSSISIEFVIHVFRTEYKWQSNLVFLRLSLFAQLSE